MSKQPPATSSHSAGYITESPLNGRHTCSSLLEDSRLKIEAQRLLSQFIRASAQESKRNLTKESGINSHNTFCEARKDHTKGDNILSGRWQMKRIVKDDVTLAQSKEQSSYRRGAPGYWSQYSNRRTGAVKISSSYHLPASPKTNTADRTLKMKLPTRRKGGPLLTSATSLPEKEVRSSRPLLVKEDSRNSKAGRRSNRARTGPTNYFEVTPLYRTNSDELDETYYESSSSPASDDKFSQLAEGKNYDPGLSRGRQPSWCQSKSHRRALRPCWDWQTALRQREVGHRVNNRLFSSIVPEYKLYKSWKGASNDVIVSAWSPDGSRFIVGATAQCDEYNMEYNRGNNLIIGDLATSSLRELPDHWVPRPIKGPDQDMGDRRLFMSVTAVQWFEDVIFSASYDSTVKIWDAANHASIRCLKTLRHSSKVQVMARSNFNPNILATGTQSIGLWNIDSASYNPLDVAQSYNKKGDDLAPTSLIWGHIPSTRGILLAGMAENYTGYLGMQYNGLLAMWIAHEASMIPVHPIPNSQSVYDIKWHPSLPIYATASPLGSQRGSGAKDAKSVVRVYEPLAMRTRSIEIDCPALDINDITFCPWNPDYLTASCTDGITYVWDRRRTDKIIHRLKHGPPLNQMDENLTREQADVGVRLALWGNGMDQFYSGATDGVLKRWNILRSPDDVLVDDVISFPEEIMCGAFSKDKSNLLIGDGGGGVHVISSSPFPYAQEDQQMRFERRAAVEGGITPSCVSGVTAGSLLLSSGQLARHPVFGVGKGPNYRGPFAAWARPEGTLLDQIAQTPLRHSVQIQQLDGEPVGSRFGLDSRSRQYILNQMRLAKIRNRPKKVKRKRRNISTYISLVSEDEDEIQSEAVVALASVKVKRRSKKVKSRPAKPVITRVESGIIDLTGEDELASPKVGELEDDFWWPDSAGIDPAIEKDDL